MEQGRTIPEGGLTLSSISPARPAATPVVLPVTKAALWLGTTAVLALLAYYFVGVDQGAVSVFGKDMHLHEFVHDARHFLGFPCH
jgi:putative cobalt transporter subunit CbtB